MRLRNRRVFLSSLAAVCLLGVSATAALAAAPVITGQSAISGHVGQTVTLTGSGFTGATQVAFHGTSSVFTVNAAGSSITATVPGGATSGKITVVTPSGTATSPKSYKVKAASLKLTGFAPLTAPVGATVTITGSDFTNATGVQIDALAAQFHVVSDTQITATVPAGAGSGRIVVTTQTGTVTSTDRLTVPVLRIAKFTPTTAAVGATVVFTGAGFTGATAVQFKGVNAVFHVDSDKQITATVPAAALSGKITIVTPTLGSVTTKARFTVS